jgi:hypothetical protein
MLGEKRDMVRGMGHAAVLTVELERMALHAIRRSYDDLNGTFFRWQLRAPGFQLVDVSSRLGRWVGESRLIELSRSLLLDHGWGVLVEVLKHEIAHQYVDEVLGAPDPTSHGPAFRKVCEQRGFDARAAGLPAQKDAPDERARVIERIAKLLALAESPNEHEAQAAMGAAQRLMLKYNIDTIASGERQNYTYRHLGVPTGRVMESLRILAALLGRYFFVEVIWVPVWRPLEGKRGTVLEVCGSLENVELAEYTYAFLVHTAERLWREQKRRQGIRSDSGRQSFLAGVMAGFRDRLELERKKPENRALVWSGDPALGGFFRGRHPSIRHTQHRSRVGSATYADGRAAGRDIVLHRGVRAGCESGLPRLLPPAR